MKKTLEKINELVSLGIIKNYAIGGGMGQFYYIEAGTTYDLDIMLQLNVEVELLEPLKEIYAWAKKEKFEENKEHILIEGIPVQFLPAYNELLNEAIDNANEVELFSIKTRIIRAEYLMAIMLQTYRSIDKTRLTKFFEDVDYDVQLFSQILNKFNLKAKFDELKEKYL